MGSILSSKKPIKFYTGATIPDPKKRDGWVDNPLSGCIGWVPFRFIRELPTTFDQTVPSTKNFHAGINPEYTPFNGMVMQRQTLKELAKLYGEPYSEELIRHSLEVNMMLLRNIFFDRFGDNAYLWWEHYKQELDKLRTKKLPADRIFLLMDVALCEDHLRKEIKDFLPKSRKALKIIDKTFDTLIKKLPPIVLFRLGVRRAVEGLSSEVRERVEKYRLSESEGMSPLLHLVNVKIIDLLKKRAGNKPIQAYQWAARLYIGFDFFPDKKFNLANSRDPNSLEREVINRAGRVKSSYNYWKDKRNRILERLREYEGMFD